MPYKDIDKNKQYMKQYYKNNKEKLNKEHKKYFKNHKDEILEYNKIWRKNTPEKVKKSKKKSNKKHYENHKEYHQNLNKEWKLNNKDKVSTYNSEYYKDNKTEINYNKNEYFKSRRKTDVAFKLKSYLRSRLWAVLKRNVKSDHIEKLIGCSISDLIIYLQKQFKPKMTWDNYGEWHVDHKTPCASFNLSIPEEQRKCFHYTNLQPLWGVENWKKGCRY